MSFASFGLATEIQRALSTQGYSTPTPIQSQAIPAVLEGQDLLAAAQTGTGKTAAFTLPLLQNLLTESSRGKRRVRVLILAPTRELAAQVNTSIRTYGKHLAVRSAVVSGGANINAQIRTLRQGVDILVATPGRLLDHVNRGTVQLSDVETLVLDEADRMLDMGFLPDIDRIVKTLPRERQTLLFSATFSDHIKKLSRKYLSDPKVLEMGRGNSTGENITQNAYLVDRDRKRELLSHLIDSQSWSQLLVFTSTKRGADRLAKQLEKDGIDATSIHGDKSQAARNRALAAFKRQTVQVLVATDVAARGIDIGGLSRVVNFELPTNAEDYVHRIGRTGRAGQKGTALSLVSADERRQFAAIKRVLKTQIPATEVSGFEPQQAPPPASSRRKSPGNPRRQQRFAPKGGRPVSKPSHRRHNGNGSDAATKRRST